MARFRTPFDALEDPTGFDPPIYPQAQVDPVDFDILDQADAGEGVRSGCAVTASSPEALTVDVASGQVCIGNTLFTVDATPDLAITTPHPTQPRFDLVCADDSGDPFIVAGAPAAVSPLFPTTAAVIGTSVVLASIYVPADLDEISSSHLTDKRAHVHPPIGLESDWVPVRATSDLARNNDASLTADTVLKFTMAASTKYSIRGEVYFTAASSSVRPRFGWKGPASPSLIHIREERITTATSAARSDAPLSSGSTGLMTTTYDATGVSVSTGATNGIHIVRFSGIIFNGSNTSPDFAFAWGQASAFASDLVRRAGSFLEYVPVA